MQSSSCVTCGTYTCQVAYLGSTPATASFTLTPVSGGCFVQAIGETIACGGLVLGEAGDDGGTTIGTWQASGLGGFTATTEGTTAVCTPAS